MQYHEDKTADDVWAAWEQGAHVVVPFFHKDADQAGERTQSGLPFAWLGCNVIARGAQEREPHIVVAFADPMVFHLPSVRMYAFRFDLPKEDQIVNIRRASNLRGTFPVIWPRFVIESAWRAFPEHFIAYFRREPQMEMWNGVLQPNIHRVKPVDDSPTYAAIPKNWWVDNPNRVRFNIAEPDYNED